MKFEDIINQKNLNMQKINTYFLMFFQKTIQLILKFNYLNLFFNKILFKIYQLFLIFLNLHNVEFFY
jgi:hypothetical protein